MNDYVVYCHTNKLDGKKYIGITSQKPEHRWRNGEGYINNQYFYRAIKKYGWHNFQHEILYTNLTKQEAESIEIQLISEYNTTCNSLGYNIEKGGNGTEKFTDEIKRKISAAKKGQKCSEETKKKISLSKAGKPTGRKGLKATEAMIRANKLGHIGQIPWNKGRAWSKEEKAKCNGIAVVCVETGKVFLTAHEAAEEFEIDFSSICKCRRWKQKTAGGYHWKSAEEWVLPDD